MQNKAYSDSLQPLRKVDESVLHSLRSVVLGEWNGTSVRNVPY